MAMILSQSALQLTALSLLFVLGNWPFMSILEKFQPVTAYQTLLVYCVVLLITLFALSRGCITGNAVPDPSPDQRPGQRKVDGNV